MANVTKQMTTKKPRHKYLKKPFAAGESFFQLILENSLGAIAVVDKKGIVQYESPVMEQVLGYRLGERLGMGGLELVHPEDLASSSNALSKLVKHSRQSIITKVRARHADGSWRMLQVYGKNLLKDPIVRGIIVHFSDITARQLIKEKLAESEEQHRALSEAASKSGLGVTILQNKQGMEAAIVLANDIGSQMTGYSKPELLSMAAWDFIDPKDLSIIIKRYRQRQKGSNPPDFYETSLRCKDGTFFPVEASVSTLSYQGKIATVVCFRDITERKNAERKLLESELKYRTLVESSREGILISKGAQSVLANKALLDMLGFTSLEELSKVPPLNLVPRDCREMITGRIEKRLKGETLNPILETGLVCRNGEIRDFEISTSKIDLTDGQYVLSIFHDITERKTAEQLLRKSQEQLHSLANHLENVREKEKATISRIIHDDLGQSLAALKMDLAWISNKSHENPKIISEKMRSASTTVDKLIERVRNISAELRPGLLDNLGLLSAMEWQVNEFQNRSGIKCRLKLEYDDSNLDPDLATGFFRVLQEALTNISLHSNAKTVKVSLKVRDGILTLKAHDDGRGITEKQIEDPNSFGLAGMQERALAMNGELQIKGVPNRGTKLTLSVPLNQRG